MKKLLFSLVLLAMGNWGFSVMAHAQTRPRGTHYTPPTIKPQHLAPDSFIEGIVTDAHTGKTLSGVSLRFGGLFFGRDEFTTKTDSQGHYHIDKVPSAPFYVESAELKGYTTGFSNGVSLHVPPGGAHSNIEMLRLGEVSGIVQDESGRPVIGARVELNPREDFSSIILKTNKNGAFQAHGVPVLVPHRGLLYQLNVTNPHLSQFRSNPWVRPFYQSGDETHLRVIMKARAVISGQLTFRGKPLIGAEVSVENLEKTGDRAFPESFVSEENDRNFPPLPQYKIWTDNQGRYYFHVSAPAQYQLTIEDDDVISRKVPTSVIPGDHKVLNLKLKRFPYGSVRGRLVNLSGRPIQGAHVTVFSDTIDDNIRAATTDSHGRFFIPRLIPAKYDLDFEGTQATCWVAKDIQVSSYHTSHVFLRGDTVPPHLQILGKLPKKVKAGPVAFHLSVSDNFSLGYVDVRVEDDRGAPSPDVRFDELFKKGPRRKDATLIWNAGTVTNGHHTLSIELYDSAGNETSQSFPIEVEGSTYRP